MPCGAKAVGTQGKGGGLATKTVETQKRGTVLATKAAETQRQYLSHNTKAAETHRAKAVSYGYKGSGSTGQRQCLTKAVEAQGKGIVLPRAQRQPYSGESA